MITRQLCNPYPGDESGEFLYTKLRFTKRRGKDTGGKARTKVHTVLCLVWVRVLVVGLLTVRVS